MRLSNKFFITAITFFILLLSELINSLRIVKESSRPKSKCFKNVTSESAGANQNTKCIALNHPYCLDIKLPYNSTVLTEYVPEQNFRYYDEIQAYLERWQGAKKLPKCWPIIQVALCSILMPQCDEDPTTGRVLRSYRPNVDICNDLVNKDECRFIERQLEGWPSIFNCNDTNLYSRNCTNELRDLKFSNTSPQPVCQYPLVPSYDNNTWFKDISGCALHCKFPLSNPNDQANISLLIKIFCIFGLPYISVSIILFRTNKTKEKTSRAAKVIERCNLCQFLFYIGWSLQFFLNSDVACSPSGSALYGLPLVANSCVLSFILTYLPSLLFLFWYAHLGKLCYRKLLGIEDKSFNSVESARILSVLNYGVPLILFVSVTFLGHIDGHGLYGICTVGQQSVIIRTFFIFAPRLVVTLYGNFYFFRIVIKLAFDKTTTMSPKLRRNFLRISALGVLTTMQVIFTLGNYYYEFSNRSKWLDSIDSYIGCKLNMNNDFISSNSNFHQECTINTGPIVTLYILEVFSELSIGIVIASWAFCDPYYRGLRRKLIDLLEDDRDRQRRAKNFINQEQSFIGRTDGMPITDPRAELDETYHDLIDMTSPTRMDGQQQNDPEDGIRNRKFSIETPTSLNSIPLHNMSGYNSENSHMSGAHNSIQVIASKGRYYKSKNVRTSRDVVNEVRYQQNQIQDGVEQQNQQEPLDHQLYFAMIQEIYQKLNPPDLSELQYDPKIKPHFEHGFCTGLSETHTT